MRHLAVSHRIVSVTAFVVVPVILVVAALGVLRIGVAVGHMRDHSMEAWEVARLLLHGVGHVFLGVGLAIACLTDLDRSGIRVAAVGCAAAGASVVVITAVHHWRRIVSSPSDIGNPDAWRGGAPPRPM